jgi:hypothetical protein
MAPTWREERPEAITAASHRAVRPSRSMVTIFSALSSSSEARIRFSSSLCGAAFFEGAGAFGTAGAFLAAFAGFLAIFFADFFAGTFFVALAAFAFAAGFLAALRVRAEVL